MWWLVPLLIWATLGVFGEAHLSTQYRLIKVAIDRASGGDPARMPKPYPLPTRLLFKTFTFLLGAPLSIIFFLVARYVYGFTTRRIVYLSAMKTIYNLHARDVERGFRWNANVAYDTVTTWYLMADWSARRP